MKHMLIYGVVVALAIFNGVFSPQTFMVFALQGIWYPAVWPAPLNVMFVLSGAISVLLHVLGTGIPAAVLEKYFVLSRLVTGLIWLAVMLVPTYQTLRHLGWV
jgi:hypothetical protein